MLNFEKFVTEKEVIVPVLSNTFQYQKKSYQIECANGWWLVKIKENNASPLDVFYDYSLLKKKYDLVKGYTYNNLIIFQNFDVARRKWNLNISSDLYFNTVQTFSAINAIIWEDRNIFFIEPNYADYTILNLKNCYDNEEDIKSFKGLTPELNTTYLFHMVERSNLRAIEKANLEKEEEEKLKKTLSYKLNESFKIAGAILLNYCISGERIIADWKLEGSSQKYNSVLEKDTFRCIEAGYCMSNDDRNHNLTSMVKLAGDYDRRDLTYITRT